MAFSIVNPQETFRGDDGSLTLSSYDSQSSGKGILLVSASAETSGVTISDVTFGGVSLTAGPGIATSSQNFVQLWWMGAPTGTEDIVVTFSGAHSGAAVIACVLEGADYSTGIVDTDTNTDTDGTPITSTITPTVANGIIIDALGTNQPHVLGATETGHTEIGQRLFTGGGGTVALGYLEYTTSAEQTIGWEFISGTNWARASHVMASFGPLITASRSVSDSVFLYSPPAVEFQHNLTFIQPVETGDASSTGDSMVENADRLLLFDDLTLVTKRQELLFTDSILLSDMTAANREPGGENPLSESAEDALFLRDRATINKIGPQNNLTLENIPKYYVRAGFYTPSWTEVFSTYGSWETLAATSSWEDLSAGSVPDQDVLRVSIDRGLGDAFDRMPVNDATFLFDNFHEDYSPEKNSKVRPNAILSIKAAMLDENSDPTSWYPLYTGYIKSIATDPALETKRQISFRCEDRGKQIKNKTANTSLQVNVQANSLFVQTFRAAGFADAAFVIDDRMGDVFSFAWLDDIPLGDAITRQLEAGAHFIYCDPRGSFIVKDRNFDAFASTDARSSDQFLAFRYNMDDRKIINVAVIGGEPRVLSTQQATVAWLQDTDVTINSGDTLEFDIDYRDPITEEQPTPCQSIVTPVSSADWQLNSEPDNIGTDLTAFGSLTFQPFATTGRVQLTYTGSQEAYVTKLQVRATPLRKQPATTARARNTTSVEQYDEQKLEVESDLIPNVFLSQAYADFFVKRYANPDGFIEFARKDEWPDILQVDLSDFMTAVNTYSGVNSTYFVDKIRHDIALVRGIEHTVVYGGRLSTERNYLVLDNDPRGKLDVRILAF